MAFEDLQDKIKEQFAEIRGKLEESPAFNTLRERYETLSPSAQTGVKIGSTLFVALMLIYFPYSYFSSSSDNVTLFEEKRTLIRKLLRASATANDGSSIDNPPPVSQLVETIRAQMQSFALLPEQMGEISSLAPDALGGRYAPKEIEQEGIGVTLKKLNLKQIIQIGYSLQTATQGVKLVGLEVRAGAPDPHYFDVVYKLARFSLPTAEEAAPSGNRGGSPRGGRADRPSANEESE